MIDIIIPVYNEEEVLREKKDYFSALSAKGHIIFVDGKSTDRTIEVARRYGEVISCQRARGIQKNKGVDHSTHDQLLFLHVDTWITTDILEKITELLNNGVVGGCLTLKIEHDHWVFRLFERVVNARARYLGVLDGDLGLFIKKSAFTEAGRFDPLPYMEDIVFSKKLKKVGRITALPDTIMVSPRKWQTQGFTKTFFRYTLAHIQLWSRYLYRKALR